MTIKSKIFKFSNSSAPANGSEKLGSKVKVENAQREKSLTGNATSGVKLSKVSVPKASASTWLIAGV